MRCSPFEPRKSPLAPPFDSAQGMLFQRGGLFSDHGELGAAYKKRPPFSKGD